MQWDLGPKQRELLVFCQQVLELRRSLAVFGEEAGRWLSAHADELTAADWTRPAGFTFGRYLTNQTTRVLVVFNATSRGHLFELPEPGVAGRWRQLINTARPGERWLRGRAVRVAARSLLLLRFEPEGDATTRRLAEGIADGAGTADG